MFGSELGGPENDTKMTTPTPVILLEPVRLLCPCNFPGKNTGVGSHFLLQGIFPNQDALEKEMAAHSSVLTRRIPGTGEPGGLPSVGSHRVGHD